MLTKVCRHCEQIKSLDMFHKQSTGKLGRESKCKDCRHIYYMFNRRRIIDAGHQWKKNNPERRNALHTDYQNRRRARKHGVALDKGITIEDIFIRDKGICGICSKLCIREDASIDHVIPISKGGAHIWDNVQLAHLLCNIRKGSKII